MASPVKESDVVILSSVAKICDRLESLLNLPGQFKAFLGWLLDSGGEVSDAVVESIQDRLMPVGAMLAYGNAALGMPSAKWLVCDGQAVSRTTYSKLFARIGTTYGAGDTTTTFNLPNFKNKFVVGSGDTYAPGGTGGAVTDTLDLTHFHGFGSSSANDNVNFATRSWSKASNGTGPTVGISGDDVDDADGPTLESGDLATTTEIVSTGGLSAVSVDTVPPYLAVSWIIKAL